MIQKELSGSSQISAALLVVLVVSAGSAPLAWTYHTGNYLWAVAVSDDGLYAIAGSDDMRTYFFDTAFAKGEPLWLHESSGYVRQVAISRNGSRAAAGDASGNLFFFRSQESGIPAWSYRANASIEALSMTRDGDYLGAGDRDGDVFVFKTSLDTPLVWHDSIPSGVLALSFSESGALVATGAQGGVYYYDEVPSRLEYAWSFENTTSFPKLVMTEDAGCIIAGGGNGYVYLLDSLGQLLGNESIGGAVSALAISLKTHRVVVGSTNGVVSLYSLGGRLEKLAMLDTRRPVTSVVVSDDGQRISVASLNGTVFMFDGSLATPLWAFNTGAIVHSLSMSSKGIVMAAGGDTGSIYLFNEKLPKTAYPGYEFVLAAVIVILFAVVVLARRWRRMNVQVRKGRPC